jgi:hypothetical protein
MIAGPDHADDEQVDDAGGNGGDPAPAAPNGEATPDAGGAPSATAPPPQPAPIVHTPDALSEPAAASTQAPVSTSPTGEQAGRVAGVYVAPLERMADILKRRLLDVLTANMYFEEETGLRNQSGQDNLTEALSHIGTLFTNAHEMSETEQAHEVHELEDHLRRSMMESYETTFTRHMGRVSDAWTEHAALVRPLQASGQLLTVPDVEKLQRMRRKAKALYRDGRLCKRGDDWATWIKGTNLLIKACDMTVELLDELNASIAAAKQHRKDEQEKAEQARERNDEVKKGKRYSLKLTVISVIISLVLGGLIGWGATELTKDDPPTPQRPTGSAPHAKGKKGGGKHHSPRKHHSPHRKPN